MNFSTNKYLANKNMLSYLPVKDREVFTTNLCSLGHIISFKNNKKMTFEDVKNSKEFLTFYYNILHNRLMNLTIDLYENYNKK